LEGELVPKFLSWFFDFCESLAERWRKGMEEVEKLLRRFVWGRET
jgi:hypothetical protein